MDFLIFFGPAEKEKSYRVSTIILHTFSLSFLFWLIYMSTGGGSFLFCFARMRSVNFRHWERLTLTYSRNIKTGIPRLTIIRPFVYARTPWPRCGTALSWWDTLLASFRNESQKTFSNPPSKTRARETSHMYLIYHVNEIGGGIYNQAKRNNQSISLRRESSSFLFNSNQPIGFVRFSFAAIKTSIYAKEKLVTLFSNSFRRRPFYI
jgi:hypothetical protein